MRQSHWTKALVAISVVVSFALGGCGSDSNDAPPAPPTLNLVETLAEAGEFNTLIAAVDAAGLVDVLSNDGPFTVFAPTDAAFALLPPEELEFLLQPENQATLIFILQYHALAGEFFESDLPEGTTDVDTLNGEPMAITKTAGQVRINAEATVIQTDLVATNGVIHAIDRVLLPPLED